MKRGQVWIETVLYTLIGLALIGLVLAFVSPKISEAKDRLLVEQTISSLNEIDSKVSAVVDGGSGNTRRVILTMKRGELYFNTKQDEITFFLDGLKKSYSEPGVDAYIQRIKIHSEKGQKTSSINLTLSYKGIANITFNGKEANTADKVNAAPTPYTLYVENNQGIINIQESF